MTKEEIRYIEEHRPDMLLTVRREIAAVKLKKAGRTHQQIAEEFGVSKSAVHQMFLRIRARNG